MARDPIENARRIEALADRLHTGAIRLLRRLRKADGETGLTGPQASALSVLVFGGDKSLTQLAEIEQVRLPTMSRLVSELEREGLVERTPSSTDRRSVRIGATALGRERLDMGRTRRLRRLTASLARRTEAERTLLARAAEILAEIGAEVDEAAAR